jgi:hypothetical protein
MSNTIKQFVLARDQGIKLHCDATGACLAISTADIDGNALSTVWVAVPAEKDGKPAEGSLWKHRKGDIYTVLGVTSEPGEDKADKFPVSVFYLGPDGRKWTRTLLSWQESFTPL